MGYFTGSMLCMLLLALTSGVTGKTKQPNILFIMSDDIGRADYQQIDPTMWTPNLMALEKRGIVMNQSYTLQACTPTRTALLTGIYPYKIGFQLGKIKGTFLRWLDIEKKLLPASLKELNYTTHAVGKWHLGFCHWNITPTRRGFDTFYGFLGGAQGYFNHSGDNNGTYDFRDNDTVAWEAAGKYSTELFTERVQDIISRHNESGGSPFFIYLAYQNAHAPFEAKQWYVDQFCANVTEEKRRIHCAMVAAMDNGIGNITKTLEEKGLTDNTIIVYLSDNGAVLDQGSYSWPLRGGKASFWEGGMRQRTIFVYPARMKRQLVGTTWDGLFHVTDWYPTLYRAAGGNVYQLQEMDGIKQLGGLLWNHDSNRNKMIYNIDPTSNRSAVRIGDYKLITGNPGHSKRRSASTAPPGMDVESIAELDKIPYKHLYNVREDPTESRNLICNSTFNSTVYKNLIDLEALLVEESKNVIAFPKVRNKNKYGLPRFSSGVWSPGWCDPYTQDYTGAIPSMLGP